MDSASAEANREHRKAEQVQSARVGILVAAARVFLRDGYQKATMRGIAKEAGYTASSLYTYFRSKQDLFGALEEGLKERSRATYSEPMPSGLNFPQRLELLGMRLATMAEQMRDVLLLMMVSGMHTPDESLEEQLKGKAEFVCGLGEWFAENARPEDLNGHDPEEVARIFLSLSEAYFKRDIQRGTFSGEAVKTSTRNAANYTLRILETPPLE